MKKSVIFICFAIISVIFLSAGYKESTQASPEIKLNPYGKNPLCALVSFETKEPSKIKLTVKGKKGAKDINHEFSEFTTKHEIPILGLYPDYKNTVILEATDKNNKIQTKTLKIKTKKLDTNLKIKVLDKTVKNPKYYFMTEGFVFDEDGEIRLFFENNGETIYFHNNEIVAENRLKGIFRYSLMGQEIKSYPYPDNFTSFTHGIDRKPNGNFLLIGNYNYGTQYVIMNDGEKIPSQGDFIVEMDHKTGKIVNIIDLAQLLNPLRQFNKKKIQYGTLDWCHINGINYDTSDNSIIASCRNSGIFKIKDKTNKLVWIIAPNNGFETSGRDGKGPDISGKVLTAVDNNEKPFSREIQQGAYSNTDYFKWPSPVHNAQIYPNNILAVYDNSNELFDKDAYTTKNSNASIYQINEKDRTVKQIWLMHLPLYAPSSSSVTFYPEDNDIAVFSTLKDSNILTRYDFDTQKILFSAQLDYNGDVSYLYKNCEFDFYPEQD